MTKKLIIFLGLVVWAITSTHLAFGAEKPPVDAAALKRADVLVSLAQVDLAEMTLTLNAAQQAADLTQNNIQGLQNILRSGLMVSTQTTVLTPVQQAEMQDQLAKQLKVLSLQQERIKLLQKTQDAAKKKLLTVQNWRAQLQAEYLTEQQKSRQIAIDQFAANMEQQQKTWLERLQQLNQKMQAAGEPGEYLTNPEYMRLEMQVFQAEEKSNLSQIQLDLTRSHNHLARLTLVSGQIISLTTLNNMQNQTSDLIRQLFSLKHMLESKNDILQQRIKITKDSMQNNMLNMTDGQTNLAILNDLLADYQRQLKDANDLLTAAFTYHDNIVRQLNLQLSSRQGLPGFDKQAWLSLGEKLLQVPILAWRSLNNSYQILQQAVMNSFLWQWGIIIVAAVGWGLLWNKLRHYLTTSIKALTRRSERPLPQQVLLVILIVVVRHLPFIMLLGAAIGLLLLLGVSLLSFNIVINLALIFIVFSFIIGGAHVLLLEMANTGQGGQDVQFYRRLKWLFIIGGVFTTMTFLGHQLPVAYDVQDLFDRFFMLFLLGLGLLLLRGWFVLPQLFGQSLQSGNHIYVKKIIRWVGLLLPVSIIFNAFTGLIGYVELAWSIGAYESRFLIILTAYLLATGILDEIFRFVSEQLIRSLKNGWLWAQAVVKPIHIILKLFLFLFALSMLFSWYGWGQHSWAVTRLNVFLKMPLFTLAGSIITPFSFIKLFLVVAILIWAARWTREVTYRWMFVGVKDISLRNSLAMFSQYTMVAIVILFGLQLVGINLTALTVIASTFALGIALGLRDLANNFVSGILLLMERPLRVGDYVTIGNYEGEVIHIGMRAVMIMTDDRQELLVPNANVFSQAFVNWTYRDSVVRSIVPLKINRVDDPHRVREIIFEVLKAVPEILAKPAVVVYLKRLDEALLEFQVEYYVDMKKIYSRNAIKSKVLLAIWDRFKSEGIHAPESAYEVLMLPSK